MPSPTDTTGPAELVVVLGTGGTIAGTAPHPDAAGYVAAQLGIEALVAAVPPLAAWPLEAEQVAQLDSKDMGWDEWQCLAAAVERQLARPEVGGLVVTHGTDTLEETAWMLHRVFAPSRPLVLTAAMRPATALSADGPRNLLDAVTLARTPGAYGVMAVVDGNVFEAEGLRKAQTRRLDAFEGGEAGPLGRVEAGRFRRFREGPARAASGAAALGAGLLQRPVAGWPRVEIVFSHAGASAALVEALCPQGVRGIVVAATGNGTVHHVLEAALRAAQGQGVAVLRASRCARGGIDLAVEEATALPSAGALTPQQARVELMLRLMADDADADARPA